MITDIQKRQVRKLIKDSTILVTGGTGSFGKTIVKELLIYSPKEIRIYSRSEDKQEQMKYLFGNNKTLHFILGDVRDANQIQRAMRNVDFVFHAAAQKQVPRSEYNVFEAVKTNILGAQNVIDASLITPSVKKVIAISTDKAVEPVNAMGMTKALQEKLFIQANLEKNKRKIAFACARYGNVFGSTGSVIPHFIRLLQQNENLTVTHKSMTRFLIMLDEAVQLVLLALIDMQGGETYIPRIPSHTITDLADAMLIVYGKNKTSKVIISGIRVGEKLHETLISPSESLRTREKKDYFIIYPDIEIPGVRKKIAKKQILLSRYSSDTATQLTKEQLIKIFKKEKLF